jgi:hypothetical protein
MPGNERIENQDSSKPGPFAPLIGQKAQGCWLGYASVLFLEFGESQPLNDVEAHPHGEWSLWCERMLWRIEHGDRVLAGAEDDRPMVESAIEEINGRVLVSGQISELTGDSLLEFTDRVVLRTFVDTSEEDARWSFKHKGADYVALGPRLAAGTDAGLPASGTANFNDDTTGL